MTDDIKVLEVMGKEHWGIRSQFLTLVKGLKDRNIDVAVACDQDDEFKEIIRNMGIEVYDFISTTKTDDFRMGKAVRSIKHCIKSQGSTILHCHGFMTQLAVRKATNGKIPVIATFHRHQLTHEQQSKKGKPSGLKSTLKSFKKIPYKHFHAIAVSNSIQKELIDFFEIYPNKIKVIPNGVELSPADSGLITKSKQDIRNDLDIPENTQIIGASSHFVRAKGIDVLLQAMPQIFKTFDNVKLVILGSGIEENKLKQKATELGIEENVIFTGNVINPYNYMQCFDLFANTSRSEGLGLNIIEAMSLGIPVISTNVGGITELMQQRWDGYLISPNNPLEVAIAITILLKEPEKGDYYSKNATARIKKHFSERIMVDSVVKKIAEARQLFVDNK